jgi:hypothetical protein
VADNQPDVLHLACVQCGLRITIDPKQILYAMRQSSAYEDMLTRWAIGPNRHDILFALEGEMDHLGLAAAYQTRPSAKHLFRAFALVAL